MNSEQPATHYIVWDKDIEKFLLTGTNTGSPVFGYRDMEEAISACEELFRYYRSRGQRMAKAIAYDKDGNQMTILVINDGDSSPAA
tara:strand:+ start:1338 stop:1595 length:258 start_codon:yes stop_codon:yes gene_type:complete